MKTVIKSVIACMCLVVAGCGNKDSFPVIGDPAFEPRYFQELNPSHLSDEPHSEIACGKCVDKRTQYLQLSDAALYDKANKANLGNCSIYDAWDLGYACTAYVKISTSTWRSQGWPLNPETKDSTGCISEYQWNGYTPQMATHNLPQNAVEQIRDALRHEEDVCGLCNSERPITPELVLQDSK